MRIICVDDEKNALLNFEHEIKGRKDIQSCSFFSNPEDVLKYIERNSIDVAFLDIGLTGMTGIELACEITKIQPDIVIIFVTAYTEYALEAYRAGGRGYLMKPYSRDDVDEIFEFLARIFKRAGITIQNKPKSRVFIKTFGQFDIWVDDMPVVFQNAKAKEMLALLVDRKGSVMSNAQLFSYLWEDKEYNKITATYIRKVIKALREELTEAGCAEILCFNRNALNMNMSFYNSGIYDCDFFSVLNNEDVFVNDYHGYYMSQYPWAEETIYMLEKRIRII